MELRLSQNRNLETKFRGIGDSWYQGTELFALNENANLVKTIDDRKLYMFMCANIV